MSEILNTEVSAAQIRALFDRHYHRVLVQTDRLIALLLILEWLAAIATAVIRSPRLWDAGRSVIHPHIWLSAGLGTVICLLPLAFVVLLPGRAVTRHLLAIAQMLMAGIIIHVSGGRIETHFLIFGSLAFLGFYRDWRVLLTASLLTAADHFVRGLFLPASIYGVTAVSPWRTLEHTAWVLFADAFLVASCVQSTREMWKIARKRGQLEQTNKHVEALVVKRTQELQASQALFLAFANHAPTIGFVVDDQSRGVWINKRGVEVFGVSEEEWKGRDTAEILGAPAEDVHEYDRTVLRTGLPLVTESDDVTNDGVRHFVTTRFAITDMAGQSFIGANAIDVTERIEKEAALAKARDAALDAARLKSEFLANMSHELRTPMNGIIGLSQLLLDTQLSALQRDYAETVVSSADALLTIVNDILDFSKIEAGKLAFDEIEFDLRTTIEELTDLLAPAARRKGLELVVSLPPSLSTGLRGDPGRLRQVLTNLIGNAIKFTERGEIRIEVAAVSRADGRATIRFDVVDSGIGISESGRARLFQTFSQADSSTTRKFGGTGLGLVIARQIVELMGGTIDVESEEGVGSRFWFTVQLAECESEEARVHVDVRGLRALVVDDRASSRSVIEEMLTAWGVDHESAADAEDARRKIVDADSNARPFDVLLLDMQLAGTDGLTLWRAVRQQPRKTPLRAILLSSAPIALSRNELHAEQLDACLLKPTRQSRLLNVLHSVMPTVQEARVDDPPQSIRSNSEASWQTPHPLRILVAEDNAVNQKLLGAQLRKLGHFADVVGNGLEVLDALGKIAYDVILMDCQMPEMDGYAATRAIRMMENEQTLGRHTQIIALTASAIESDRQRCLDAGMDDHVVKPLKIEALDRVLRRAATLCVAA